mmetsp:Transcript_136290/g.322894  ORF Transcript_136290/g.322894 Transcript_136290/m.322894 type:complete len:113 (+) Transcript_136290:460-798(+)
MPMDTFGPLLNRALPLFWRAVGGGRLLGLLRGADILGADRIADILPPMRPPDLAASALSNGRSVITRAKQAAADILRNVVQPDAALLIGSGSACPPPTSFCHLAWNFARGTA